MSVGVYTIDPRVSFVEKILSEVGDGTAWPMLVTLDQLAEILYRVKDAWFTSGSVVYDLPGYDPGDPPIPGHGVHMEGGTPPTQLINGDGWSEFYIRGYCWWGNYYALHPSDANYFGDAYGPNILPGSPGTFDYMGVDLLNIFPPTYAPYVTLDESLYRDMGINERAIWLPEREVDPSVNETAKINGDTLRTAFSQEMAGSSSTGYMIDHAGSPYQLRLEVYPEVAWVDENESGNPFDPANKMYLKLRFGVLGTGGYEGIYLDTIAGAGGYSYQEATDLVFGLAETSTTAKLYAHNGIDLGIYSSSTPFTVTAQEWWPYAKNSPAVPVWNSNTGALL